MVLEVFFNALDVVFEPLLILFKDQPFMVILLIAAAIAFITTLANKLLVNQDRLEYLKKEMQGFQQEMMEARKTNDPQAMAKVQKKQAEFMDLQKEMMTMSFKPMLVTFVPIIIVFWWLAQSALNTVVVKLPTIAYYVLLVPLWHMFYHPAPTTPPMAIEWLGWYILCSFGLSMLFRKILGIKGQGM